MTFHDLRRFLVASPGGRLLVFAAAFALLLALIPWLRRHAHTPEMPAPAARDPDPSQQRVESVRRPMEVFRPPPPRTEPPPAPVRRPTPPAERLQVERAEAPPPPPPAPLPIRLVADASRGREEPQSPGSVYAPYGRLIPCQTVITVDSASIRTPIIGLVTEDLHHAGQLVLPAGTEVHGTAQTDRSRERLAGGTAWTLVWQSGEELSLRALALDREFDSSSDQAGWGITDGSAGIRGQLLKSDDLAEIKLFAATFLAGAAKALTEREHTLLGALDSRSLNNAPLKGAEEILGLHARRILESIQRDGFYVRVPAGKQFYLYVLQTLDLSEARVGAANPPSGDDHEPHTP